MAGLDSGDVRAELEGKEGHDAAKPSHDAPASHVTYRTEDDETTSGLDPPLGSLEPLTLTMTQPSRHTKQTMHPPSTLPDMSASSTPSRPAITKFGAEEYAIMLNYFEDPANKAKIWGAPGVAPLRKVEAWKELAALINKKCKGKHNMFHKSMADRWRTYFNKYKAAHDKSMETGFGVTEGDKKKNIHTVAAKLDMLCPHYARMHALVGKRPNVSAAASFESSCANTNLNALLSLNKPAEACNRLSDPNQDDLQDPELELTILPPSLSQPHVPDVLFDDVFQTEQPVPLPNISLEPLLGDLDSLSKQRERSVVAGKPSAKRVKTDKRKEPPTLSNGKTPTQTRYILAQTIQESPSTKAEIMGKVEEQKLEIELMRWRFDREEKESQRKAEREEAEIRRREEKEEAETRRKEERDERQQERKFALVSSMMKDGKSPSEIKEILDMLT